MTAFIQRVRTFLTLMIFNLVLSTNQSTMGSSNSQIKSSLRELNKTVYGTTRDRFEDSSKAVFKELLEDKKMTESPGFVYDSHLINTAINKRNHAFSFSKKSRDLSFKSAKRSIRA